MAGAEPVVLPEGLNAGKVIGVHLNYHSRAAQRGRVPTEPSYFLKPATSLSAGGDVVRPPGTELLAFEAEIAVIIGARARRVSPEEAGRHIGWYAPANDFGLHDFRWADRGSNLMAKGQDGYSPLGPAMAAEGVDPTALRLTGLVNGAVRQDATGADLIFTFAQLVADLSRFMTLEPGDVILTGTPAGANLVEPGDVVEVRLEGAGSVTSTIVQGTAELAPYGAMPRATDAARAFATGVNPPPPTPPRSAVLSGDAVAALRQVSTATLTVQLTRRGIQTTFLGGLRPTRPDLRMVGYAHTLRYVAVRADVRESLRGSEDAQKRAIESVAPGDVLIMEARGEPGAGTIGDILAARVLARGGAGIVTDGGVRDTPGVTDLDMPTYYRAANASSLWNAHIPLDVDVPVTCAGVLVMPGDVIVGDAEGVVVLPFALAEEIAHAALEVEEREAFALERVKAGESFRGLYPLSEERRRRVRELESEAERGAHPMSNPFAGDASAVRGAITPLITPFTDTGELDLEAIPRLDRLAAGARDARHLGGRLHRRADLETVAERIEVMRAAAAAIDGRVPFLPGTGTALMAETLELTAEAQRLGASAALVVTPYYGRAQQEGLFQWYSRVAAEFPDLPIIVYNVPVRAAVDIAPATVGRLRRAHPNIVGIKETTRDFEHVSYVLNEAGTDFIALSGIELLCYPMLTLGGAGHLSCVGQLRPRPRRRALRRVRGRRPRARPRAALRPAPPGGRRLRRDQPGAGQVGDEATRPAGLRPRPRAAGAAQRRRAREGPRAAGHQPPRRPRRAGFRARLTRARVSFRSPARGGLSCVQGSPAGAWPPGRVSR